MAGVDVVESRITSYDKPSIPGGRFSACREVARPARGAIACGVWREGTCTPPRTPMTVRWNILFLPDCLELLARRLR